MKIENVRFPDTGHPMNKGTDNLVEPEAFTAILLGELRRQAINEVLEEKGQLAQPPILIYSGPFPGCPFCYDPTCAGWCA